MTEQILQASLLISSAMLLIAIALVTLRLLRGPSLPDRVIALDLLGTLAAGTIGIYAISQNEPIYIYVTIVLSLLLFVGTVGFAYYLEKGSGR